MIIAKNDEEKRSRLWRRGMVISSILIVVIAVYLLIKMFTANPLEGTWESEDGNFVMSIGVNGDMTVKASDVSEGEDVDIRMEYTIDKDDKVITIKENSEEFDRLAENSDGMYTRETLESALAGIVTTFNYSIEGGQLTFTEREYGEQLTFTKK